MRARSSLPSALKPTSPPETASVFRTQSTNFATYILAAAKLQFRSAELASNGVDVDLLFDDPDGVGPTLLARFSSGVVEMVNVKLIFEVRSYLLGEIRRIQAAAGVGNGTSR